MLLPEPAGAVISVRGAWATAALSRSRRSPMRLARPILLASLAAASTPALASPAGNLLPHRAVYDLALDSASDRSGITGIDGRMVYEFAGSPCEGYTVTFRFVTRIDTDGAYANLELPQDVCAAGRVQVFGKGSSPV